MDNANDSKIVAVQTFTYGKRTLNDGFLL